MAIITISRGTFAGGATLATLLGQRLGFRTVSREMLYHKAGEDFGVSDEELAQIMTWTPSRRDPAVDQRRRLFVSIQAALCALLQDDDVVYHGQAGHLLLPEIAHVVRVRLIAPRTKRIEMAIERETISAHQASCRIDQVDSRRSRWTEFVFGANWADPSLYDVVLNLDRMDLEDAAEIVRHTARLPAFRATDESRCRLQDLALQSAVLARLLGDSVTANLELKVEACGGRVTLSGPVDSSRRQRVLEVARQVEQASEVVLADGSR